MTRTVLCAATLLSSLLLCHTSLGETLRLSIDDAVARASKSNPDLRVELHDVEGAEANVERNSGWLANNPYLSMGTSHGSSTSVGTSGGAQNYFGYLSQEFELAGQNGLRLDSATHARDRQQWDLKNSAAGVVAEVKAAFVRAQVNVQRVTLAHRSVDISTDLVGQMEKENPSASTDRIELNAARVQQERAQLDLAEAEQSRDDSMDTLRHLLAVPFTQEIELAGMPDSRPSPLPPLADLLSRALQQRADLVALRHSDQAAGASFELAKRERIPNVTLTGSVSHFDGVTYGGGDIGFPLPVFQTKSAEVHEASVERNRVADQIDNLQGQITMEVRTAYRACVVAAKKLESQNRTIVPLSEEDAQLEQRLFDRDEVGASDLIGQQIDLLTARGEQLDAIESYNTSRFELERVVGGPIDASPATESR